MMYLKHLLNSQASRSDARGGRLGPERGGQGRLKRLLGFPWAKSSSLRRQMQAESKVLPVPVTAQRESWQ